MIVPEGKVEEEEDDCKLLESDFIIQELRFTQPFNLIVTGYSHSSLSLFSDFELKDFLIQRE